MTLVADLLHSEPELWLDRAALAQALTFAFAAGGSSEDFDRLLNQARLEPSRFQPECFARDLFLNELVGRCVVLRLKNRERTLHRAQLVRELSRPPEKLESVRFRQEILRELAERPDLRSLLERSWLQIEELRTRLEAADRGKRYDAISRRIDILRDLKHAVDFIANGFEGATSGLSRARELATGIAASKGYKDLRDLLDYEGHLATVDLRVQVGNDGRLRAFEIIRAEENAANRFYVSPLRRLVSRIKMLLSGYRFREAELIGRLVNQVFDEMQDAVISLFQLGLHFEFYLAALSLRDRANAAGLSMCLPSLLDHTAPDAGRAAFRSLFNPLLLLEGRPPVPCDLEIQHGAIVIITGPNSGGKTRLLEAVGLSQLLGQAGMFVPAREACITFRDGLFVSLIQETTADQAEGRLGTELLRIRRMFEKLDFNSLVVLDELCSGTNPSEGEGIFELVVALLSELKPQAFITTHFLEFAARLARERPVPGLDFLQVELDSENEPTYGFVGGVAPTSLAGKTAERLGVTREALEGLVLRKKRDRRAALPLDASVEPRAAADPREVTDRAAFRELERTSPKTEPEQG